MDKKAWGVWAIFFLLAMFFLSPSLSAAEIGKEVKITYLGHSAFKLVSPQGVVLLIDPYLSNNPKTPPDRKEVDKADMMQVEGRENKEIAVEVPKVLEVIGLENKINNFPNQLSGGEQQRLAIARAFVNNPDIIIADEPTGNLDPYNSYEVILLLQKINKAGKTVILATHDREIINKLGKRVVTIENGKILRDEAEGRFII